jgi:hypothetical protein
MVRALLIIVLVFFGMVGVSSAQSSPATSGQQDGSNQTKNQNPPAAESKKKKVWTNDGVGSAKDSGSFTGPQDSGSTPTSNSCTSCSKPSPYERLVKSYRDKLEPLRSNLADIDRKIQMAKEAHGNASEDTAAWIKVYDGKRKDVLAKMERIEDEARRAGVLPGDLRE